MPLKSMVHFRRLTLLVLLFAAGCNSTPGDFDVVIRGGDVYDGLGGQPIRADVALNDDRIAEIGDLGAFSGT